ncbi:MAG TPA: patatin-like phospholipase RssA [Nevskia sp.]|nr:patatin-like phospholipase RssA [Nevskia sp.]
MQADHTAPVIGIALGSGSARGWSHLGVILELEAMGIRPHVVAGTSIGALVGAVYVSGQLQDFTDWVTKLSVRDVVKLMDFTFSGGFVKGERLFGYFGEHHPNPNIQELKQRYVSVATEMKTGREIWVTEGPVLDAARASCAIPGLFTPVKLNDRWMLDGGLVNPVPVSAARALGADVVIAVNLNAQLVGLHLSAAGRQEAEREVDAEMPAESNKTKGFWHRVVGYLESGDPDKPGFFDVVASSVNIMQDRLTRSRMAGDPPELTLLPRLEDFAMMDFHRAAEAVAEGRRVVQQSEAEIRAWAQVKARA